MATEVKKVDFTSGRIFSKMVVFTLPIIFTNLLQVFYNAADMMIVSLSDEVNAVGAVGVTGSFINLVLSFIIGLSVGANVIVSKWIGAKEKERAQKAVHTSIALGFWFGMITMVIGLLTSRLVLQWMGTSGNLLDLAVTYTDIYFAGLPFMSLANYTIAVFRAKGDSKTPLVVLGATGLLNVGLNFFFVVGMGMSVEGVAFSTMIANLVSSVVLLIKLSLDTNEFTKFSFKKLKIHKKSLKEIIKAGVPAGIQSALFGISNLLIQSSVVKVNNMAMSGIVTDSDYQPIVSGASAQGNLEGFIYTAMNAVYQGVVTFVSQNMGAKKTDRIYKIMYYGIAFVSGVGLTMAVIMYLLRIPLLKMYGVVPGEPGSLEAMAMKAATVRVYLIGFPYFMCGIMEVFVGVLRGVGKSMLSMFISLIGACLLRIIWLWVLFPIFPTLECVYLSYPVTWIITIAMQIVITHMILKRIAKENARA